MHTTEIFYDNLHGGLTVQRGQGIEEFRFHHNGDFSGDVLIVINGTDRVKALRGMSAQVDEDTPEYFEVRIPFSVLKELVGRYLQDRTIEHIENRWGGQFLDEFVGGS